jgi:hypothetical protein
MHTPLKAERKARDRGLRRAGTAKIGTVPQDFIPFLGECMTGGTNTQAACREQVIKTENVEPAFCRRSTLNKSREDRIQMLPKVPRAIFVFIHKLFTDRVSLARRAA